MDNNIHDLIVNRIESLSEQDRLIICLIYFEKLTYTEVALLLNIEVEDVKTIDETFCLALTSAVKA